MDYQETISFLYTRLPLFSRLGPAAYKEDLDNTIELCAFLNNPERKFKSIHIAGTNGKGSVSHMLASVFQAAGYKTGLYTSPHLKDFRERIKVNGEWIPQEFIIEFTEKIMPEIDRIEPSFFEITVAMAFEYFASERVDIAIIETGLGGRLDSTNVIQPELSVITNIGADHMNLLGDTIEKIAREKAGIIKPDTPVVVGQVTPETRSIFEQHADQQNAKLTIASEVRHATEWEWKSHELIVSVAREHHQTKQVYHLDLPGLYQVQNLLTALTALDVMHSIGWNIDEHHIHEGLKNVRKLTGLHGRWEIIHQSPLIVLDVAHNEDGIKMLTRQIEVTDHHNLHIIIGMVKDKEISKALSLLPKTARYYFTQSNIPRALDGMDLQALASTHELAGNVYPDVNAALDQAKLDSHPNDLIIVCGSVFLVGEVN